MSAARGFDGRGIAIVGMSGRFPPAGGIAEYWRNLRDGVEGFSTLDGRDLLDASLTVDDGWVRTSGRIEGIDLFDAPFFGCTPREAENMDPQHRLFLECAWEALEDAGLDPRRYTDRVGVYAGCSLNTYLLNNLLGNRDFVESVGTVQLALANDKDFLASRVSYKLDLSGPSVVVQSACSTGLLAVHLACQALAAGECDVALAGAASIHVPDRMGYRYDDGGILSPDGHCRPFDAEAAGTVPGAGVGVVALKPLEAALADGDHVRAFVRGSAVNNDGSRKIGFTAPSVDRQRDVVRAALENASVAPETIGYLEAHGTGTPLGDPIEVAALNEAFGAAGGRESCALGSAKSNVGHLDAAAGVAGLIKAALMLEHRELVPTLHYRAANPQVDFDSGPFYVNTELRAWPRDHEARRAGVSSFGIGGTNVHVVLEEAPARPAPGRDTRPQLLVVSARSSAELEKASERVASRLAELDDDSLADAAATLQTGRAEHACRRSLVASDAAEGAAALRAPAPAACVSGPPSVAFLFPGQGAQRAGAGRELYEQVPSFRADVDRCSEILAPLLGLDVRGVLFDSADDRLTETALAQPALFTLEWALAQLWLRLDVRPEVVAGHSIGEYVAACIADVMRLEDALAVVAERGRLMQELPRGTMLALAVPEHEALRLIDGHDLALAAVNAESACVASGPDDAIAGLAGVLEAEGVAFVRLKTSHAFHSRLVEPILDRFEAFVARVELRRPALPVLSNVTGSLLTPEDAVAAAYWRRHVRATVRFGDNLAHLLAHGGLTMLEVGPGAVLTGLARKAGAPSEATVWSLPRAEGAELASFLAAVGRIWCLGAGIEWSELHDGARRRIPLPAYPFARRSHWVAPNGQTYFGHPGDFIYRPPDSASLGAEASARPDAAATERLPASVAPAVDGGNDAEAARGPQAVEVRLTELWRATLGVDDVGADDNFFALGGDSLMVVQLMNRVRSEFGTSQPLDRFFARPTVAGTAAHLIAESGMSDGAAATAPVPSTSALDAPIVVAGPAPAPADAAAERGDRDAELSVFFFSADSAGDDGDRYALVRDVARFADANGFAAIWTPERHFHRFGGLYPNPALLAAALATMTERIGLRAGSVVSPLHDPIRIAEEWSVVDHLSNGRIGVSFASGFHPNDFTFAPERWETRRTRVFEDIETVRRLWRGEAIERLAGTGAPFPARVFPSPLSPELPVWVTAMASGETFAQAGAIGANVLTALLGLDVEQLAQNIAVYRSACAEHNHERGTVTVMVHAYVGEGDEDGVRELVREPFGAYLATHTELTRSWAKTLGKEADLESLSQADREAILEFGFRRYYEGRSLLGTLERTEEIARRLHGIGVDEIACLVDFGLEPALVLESLDRLVVLRERLAASPAARVV